MLCPKCKRELVINQNCNDEVYIEDIDDKRIDVIVECKKENDGCGFEGFAVVRNILEKD